MEKSIEVQALMLRFPAIGNAPFYEDTCWRYISVNDTSPEAAQAAHGRGLQREPFATAEELLREFSN